MIIDKLQRKITSVEIRKVNQNLGSISLKLLFVVRGNGVCIYLKECKPAKCTERQVWHAKLFNKPGGM